MIFVRGAQTFSDDYIISLLSTFSLLQKLTVKYPCALSLSPVCVPDLVYGSSVMERL